MAEVLISSEHDGVVTLTLNRPEVRNALDAELFDALNREVYRVRFEPSVRVLVLQGAGGHFCAGADLSLLEGATEAQLARSSFARLEFVQHLARMDKTVIASVAGNALGAGCSLALLADFVVAADDAAFQMPFTRLGAVVDAGATWVVPRLVGMPRAKAFTMLGERLSGAVAAQWGLIYKAVPPGALDAEVAALVERLKGLSAEALGLTKRGLAQAFDVDIDQAVDWELRAQVKLLPGEYVQQQVRAFRERKKGG